MIEETKPDEFPANPPKLLFIIGIMFLLTGLLVSPELLKTIGIMRKSLNSDIQMVRDTAHMTVYAFKILCLIMFTAVAVLVLIWKYVRSLKIVRNILDYQPLPKIEAARHTSFVNLSSIIIISATILGITFVASGSALFKESTLIEIIREDGFIEQLTAVVFLLCSIFSAYIAFKSKIRSQKIVHALFALGFFFCFGEEISWAQRIIGFETPKAFTDMNVQNEFNLHNIGGYLSDHLFIAGVFMYGFVLPLLTKIHPFWLKLFDKIGLPIASIGLAVGFFIISLLHDWTIYRILPHNIIPIAELRELLSSIGFCLLMIESLKLSTNTSKFHNF